MRVASIAPMVWWIAMWIVTMVWLMLMLMQMMQM
jgi:hypothetical protein